VLYKFFFLIVTAIVLYFIVLRDYLAVWLGGLLTIIIGLYGLTVHHTTSTLQILVTLNVVAGAFTLISIICLLTRRIRSHA